MDKFYIINDKPEILFTLNNAAIIYKIPEAAFNARDAMNRIGFKDKLRVYEVMAFGSLMTEGLNFREVEDEGK